MASRTLTLTYLASLDCQCLALMARIMGLSRAHTNVQALVGRGLYATATIMDNTTMCHLWPNLLKRLLRISLCLAWIALAALTVASATAQSSAASSSAEFRTAIASGGGMQPCGGASNCNAGPCSVFSCFSHIAIESRALDLGSYGQGTVRLPLSREAPSLSSAPQPHPPRI